MERTEKLHFQQSIENYFEDKKVYFLFEKLLKELVIIKPDQPIDYLIKRLKTPDTKRIFITGSAGVNRREIALSLANHFNYEGISIGDILRKELSKKLDIGKKIEPYLKISKLVPDELVIELIKQELIRLEKNSTSYIVEGFPRNRVQAMFLQSVGILPDNIILITSEEDKIKEVLNNKISSNVKDSNKAMFYTNDALEEYLINFRAVKEVYPNHTELKADNKDMSHIIDDISRILKFKNKTYGARRPPRILLLGPPCSKKHDISEVIAKKYNIVHISISELLNAEVRKNNDNSRIILDAFNSGSLVDDKFVFKLLEDRLFASDAMINGWILTGFPKNNAQLKFIESEHNRAFKPSLVVSIELEDEIVLKRSSLRRIDPLLGKCVYLDSTTFDPQSESAKRLVVKTEDKEQPLKKRLENWKTFAYSDLAQIQGVIRLNGENNINTLIENISDSLENSS